MDTQNKLKEWGVGLSSMHSTWSSSFIPYNSTWYYYHPTMQVGKRKHSWPSTTQLVNGRAGQSPGQAEACTQFHLSSSGRKGR